MHSYVYDRNFLPYFNCYTVEDEIPLADFLTDPDELRNFLISNWSLTPNIVDTILNSSIKLRSVRIQIVITTLCVVMVCDIIMMYLQAIDWITGQDTSSFLNNPFGSRVLRQATIPPILPNIFPNVSELNQLLVVSDPSALVNI